VTSLHILHVTPYSADSWAYGGIPRLAATLARGLARRGHHVTVCTTDVRDETSRLSSAAGNTRRQAWPPRDTDDGVEMRVFPNLSNRLAYHFQAFLPLGLDRYLKAHAGTFDVAHLHACRNVPGAIAARHLVRSGVPYILAPNGTAPLIERRRLAKRGFDLVVGRRMLRRAARVLAVTDREFRQLCDLGVHPDRIALVPNPVDLDEFACPIDRAAFRRRFGLPASPLVLFLGKLTPRKRLDVLARAMAALPRRDAHLVIAGNDMGSGSMTRALIRSLGLEHRTVFTGLLAGRERLEALAAADVLVYPSQDEIFGLVPLEALLSRTPVIVAGDSGCGEVVRGTGGGLVVPVGSHEALAKGIASILDAPAEWRSAASRAAVQVRTRYGEDAVCSELEHVYRGLVA
jgi:glycosyltransferase involved in cell wall biosynthesis